MNLQFEWDVNKAESNLKKHKIDFEEESTVFNDPFAAIFDDHKHSTPEERREIIIGTSDRKRLLLTSFTERALGTIRIISSRPATKHERSKYEKNIWQFSC